jgi:hypothetical protein
MLHVCDTCTFTRVVVSASFSSGKYFFSSGKCFCPERHNTTHNANPMKNGCDRTSSTTGTFLVSSRAHPCHRHAPRTIDSTTFSALLVGGRMVLCVSFVHMPDGPTDYRRPTPQNRTSPITGAVRPAPHPHPRCRHRPRGTCIGFGIGLPRFRTRGIGIGLARFPHAATPNEPLAPNPTYVGIKFDPLSIRVVDVWGGGR